jgi:capsular polysaccharide export protein
MESLHNRPPDVIYALDFFFWKRRIVRRCFPDSRVKFISRPDQVPDQAWLAVWGMQTSLDAIPKNVQILRVEDGFLRSVGLGADIILPISFVIDRRGLYYDATKSSDLEMLLATSRFDPELLKRAAALRQRIVNLGLTKYNVGAESWRPPDTSKRLILVPGQVESDAALEFSAPGLRRNMDLLRAVREANPDAHIIYKPHPDVVARLRPAGVVEHTAMQWCDEMVIDAPMDRLLTSVHEVHVITSLTGFETLLRGKPVTCYGHPFYAGWGLTTDIIPIPRRQRRLTLDELVAGALILYPVYFDRKGAGIISPEAALDQLIAWRAEHGGKMPWWRKVFRVVIRQVKYLKRYLNT